MIAGIELGGTKTVVACITITITITIGTGIVGGGVPQVEEQHGKIHEKLLKTAGCATPRNDTDLWGTLGETRPG